jgi:hypothetical protein
MSSEIPEVNSKIYAELKRAALFLIKGAALVLLLLLIRFAIPSMPAWLIAIVWALLSVAATIGLAYHVVVDKKLRLVKYETGGVLARFTSGLAFSLIWRFAVSAVFIAGLLTSLPKWDNPEWILTGLAIPLFLVIELLIARITNNEVRGPFRPSTVALISSALLGVLLALLYAAVIYLQPATNYNSLGAAVAAAYQHLNFENSPSALLSQGCKILALLDGGTQYFLSKVAGIDTNIYAFIQMLLSLSAFLGIASLLGSCSLSKSELKEVFEPLSPFANKRIELVKRVAILFALPIVLFSGCLYANGKVDAAANSPEGNQIESLVREIAGCDVLLVDGKYFDRAAANILTEQFRTSAKEPSSETVPELKKAIDEIYDGLEDNVDSYLKWFEDHDSNSAEIIRTEFKSMIDSEIDASTIKGKCEEYYKGQVALFREGLQSSEIANMPTWLAKSAESKDFDSLLNAAEDELSRNIIGYSTRSDGDIANDISEGVTSKIADKGIFDDIAHDPNLVERLVEAIRKKLEGQDRNASEAEFGQKMTDAMSEAKAEFLESLQETCDSSNETPAVP